MSERVFSVTTGRAAHRFRAQRCEYTRELYTLFLTRFWLPVSPACLLRLAVSSNHFGFLVAQSVGASDRVNEEVQRTSSVRPSTRADSRQRQVRATVLTDGKRHNGADTHAHTRRRLVP